MSVPVETAAGGGGGVHAVVGGGAAAGSAAGWAWVPARPPLIRRRRPRAPTRPQARSRTMAPRAAASGSTLRYRTRAAPRSPADWARRFRPESSSSTQRRKPASTNPGGGTPQNRSNRARLPTRVVVAPRIAVSGVSLGPRRARIGHAGDRRSLQFGVNTTPVAIRAGPAPDRRAARAAATAGYSALTAATRSASPCFASANSIPVLGLTYSSLSMPA